MEVLKHMRSHVLSDRRLSEAQIGLKLILPLLEGAAQRSQSIVNALVDVLLSRLELEVGVSEPAQRIAPLQCSLVVPNLPARIERFLVVELETVVFPEGRAPSQLG